MISYLVAVAMLSAEPSLASRVDAMERQYDIAQAELLTKELRQTAQLDAYERNLLLARCALSIAEIKRIEFERTPPDDRAQRQAIGKEIDAAADETLSNLANAPETSETWRVRADAYGVKIRSNYQAQRYHKDMEDATAHARALDPKNARAVVSAAKPLIFADSDHGGDMAKGLAVLEDALTLDPAQEEGQLLRAFALRKLGRDAEAQEAYRQVLARNPACAPAKYELAHWQEALAK